MNEIFRGRVDIGGPPFPINESFPIVPTPEPECARLPTVIREPGGDVAKKPKKEEPRIRAIKGLNGLSPATPFDQELLSEVGFGREVEITIHQERSGPHHRLYWALLHELVSNSEGKYLSAVDLHEALKVALGVTRRIKLLTPSEHATIALKVKNRLAGVLMWVGGLLSGVPLLEKAVTSLNEAIAELGQLEQDCTTILLPGSTGFWAMDQVAFKRYFDAALSELRKAGYDPDTAIEEIKKKIGTKYRNLKGGSHGELEQASGPEQPDRQADRDDGAVGHLSFQERGGQGESPF